MPPETIHTNEAPEGEDASEGPGKSPRKLGDPAKQKQTREELLILQAETELEHIVAEAAAEQFLQDADYNLEDEITAEQLLGDKEYHLDVGQMKTEVDALLAAHPLDRDQLAAKFDELEALRGKVLDRKLDLWDFMRLNPDHEKRIELRAEHETLDRQSLRLIELVVRIEMTLD